MGVSITKLFSLNSNFEDLQWLAGALACGLASALMTVTKTVYPPAGATALLAAVDPEVVHLGWYLLPLVCLSAVVTLVVSLLINNIQRQYPTYWWTPADLSKEEATADVEKTSIRRSSSHTPLSKESLSSEHHTEFTIKITPHRILVPDHLYLAQEEMSILEILRDRLEEGIPRCPEDTAPVAES